MSTHDEDSSPRFSRKIMVRATVIFAPEEIPKTNGPAMGLRKKICIRNPASAKAPPSTAAAMIPWKTDFPYDAVLHLISGMKKQNLRDFLYGEIHASRIDIPQEKDQKKQRQYAVTDDIPDILVSSCLLFRRHTLLLYLRNPRSPQNQSAPAASVLSLPDRSYKNSLQPVQKLHSVFLPAEHLIQIVHHRSGLRRFLIHIFSRTIYVSGLYCLKVFQQLALSQ